MKFAVLECLVLGASLVAASPIRVIMVSSHSEVPTTFRFGKPVADINPNVAQLIHPPTLAAEAGTQAETGSHRRPGCRFRQKAIVVSNAFRKALGLPLIEAHPKSGNENHDGVVRIMPVIGTPPFAVPDAPGKDVLVSLPPPPPHGHEKFHHRLRDSSFLTRLHYALTALGPWEGRAVAFVLGCGIGVLLRMFWVLAIISYRSIRGPKEDDNDYPRITEYVVAEEIFVAPPNYTVTDEKAPLPEEDSKAPAPVA